MNLIVAVDLNWGIGNKKTGIPWDCKADLNLFKNYTMDNIIVVGVNTAKTLPFLKNRMIFCMVRNILDPPDTMGWKNSVYFINNFNQINNYIREKNELKGKDIWISGGAWLYEKALTDDSSNRKLVDTISLSIIKKNADECDVFFNNWWLDGFSIVKETEYVGFNHYILKRGKNTFEWSYLKLMKNIIENDKKVSGRNGITYRLFSTQLNFDLTKGFPALTTKRMFWRGVSEEFIMFIRGKTDTKEHLEDKGISIWKGNTRRNFLDNLDLNYAEGVMGPMYGYQWRNFGSEYRIDPSTGKPLETERNSGIDQLQEIIDTINSNPTSRRLLMTSYNPLQSKQGVLYPCHSIIIQFGVDEDGYLDMIVHNRSQDVFLGVPFNIASSALLLSVVALLTNLIPRHMTMNMGDTHIYSEHLEAVNTQLKRIPYSSCKLKISRNFKTLDDLCNNFYPDDFQIVNYNCHPKIKAPMIV